ncbi:glycosyl hydrolase family 28-related protein [Paenibacillus sp. GYB003]|uniref:glycosyl hydrolase family 28-related protein n=1 Tax=Paenibacillus sp. GYB003 TaxID=2994392 RepID=UPI002F967967
MESNKQAGSGVNRQANERAKEVREPKSPVRVMLDRRKLLAAAGLAGVAAVAGGLWKLPKTEAAGPVSSDGVSYQPGASLPARSLTDKLGEWVSVKDFGAKGDGVTNDTAAIQQAFAATGANGAVFFPAGTYIVSPAAGNGYIVTIGNKASFSIFGQGSSSIIKVADGAGNYKGIVGLSNPSFELARFHAESLVFDHNRQNNVLPSLTDYEAQLRSTISNYSSANGYGHIRITGCTILNADGVVSFYFPKGIHTGKSVKIENCSWISGGNGNGNDFDQSFINATCDSMTVTGCSFEGTSWAFAPRTAIETHASNCVIANNTITNFQIGMNLTGIAQSGTTVNQLCANNSIDVSREGILIWSQSLAPANASVGFKNMIVEGNIVNVNPYQYNFGTPVGACRGISIYGGATAIPYENLAVTNNIIRYERETGTAYVNKFPLKSFGAIGSYENGNQTNLADRFSIKNNKIVNCPTSGIFFDLGRVRGLAITNNELIDCGTTISGTAQFSNKVPIYLATSLESDCLVADNTIELTDSAPTVTDFIFVRDRANGGGTFKCFRNEFVLKAGADTTNVTDYVGVYNSAQKLQFEGTVPLEAIRLPAVAGGIGSKATIADSGCIATKTNASTFWQKESYGASAPAAGSWNPGDIVYNTAPAPSGHRGWICTEAGSPGTWKAFGPIEA